jgi:F0F1-type ATP synthase assembly protein I
MVIYFSVIVLSNIFVGLLIGYLIYKFTDQQIWMVILMFLGIVSGLYSGIKELLKEVEKHERTEKEAKRDGDKSNYNNGD